MQNKHSKRSKAADAKIQSQSTRHAQRSNHSSKITNFINRNLEKEEKKLNSN